MLRYISIRIGYAVTTLFFIASLTFVAMKLLPGDPYSTAARITDAQKAIMDEKYGFDEPIYVQFYKYMLNAIQGDFGVSFQYAGREVSQIIAEKLPASALLGFEAMVIGIVFGIILGIIAALKHNTFLDYGTTILAVLGTSIPSFIFAVLLQYIFAVKFPIFPVAYWEGPIYHVLPAFALAVGVIATLARFMRTEMLEVLNSEYITMAEAKGLTDYGIVVKHSIRNSLIPVITILGPMTVFIMTGTLVIENIFSIPGLGKQFVDSILTTDYPMIMGITLFYSSLFIGSILVVDILYGIIDPRIRLSEGGNS